jgi:hypothetical protein
MNFNEAFDAAENEDTLFSPETGEFGYFKCKKDDIVSGRISGFELTPLRTVRKDWKVIKAKKQPMTEREAWLNFCPKTRAVIFGREDHENTWNKSAENTHLIYGIFEREDHAEIWNKSAENTHLLYDDLIKALDYIRSHPLDYSFGSISNLKQELEKIKQYRDKK